MIRIGLPLPTLYRINLRAQLFASKVSRAFRAFFLEDTESVTVFDDICVVQKRVAPGALEPVDLDKFERRYQDLIDLLCVAAKDGATVERCERYMDLQDWFGSNYGLYRGLLLPQLRLAANQADPFEAIFMHESLKDAIHGDEMIRQVQHTRHALEMCIEQAGRTRV